MFTGAALTDDEERDPSHKHTRTHDAHTTHTHEEDEEQKKRAEEEEEHEEEQEQEQQQPCVYVDLVFITFIIRRTTPTEPGTPSRRDVLC